MPENDYADRWEEREQMVERMSREELRCYSIGLAHAYTDVFKVFDDAFSGRMPGDIHDVFERFSAQWADVVATQVRAAL